MELSSSCGARGAVSSAELALMEQYLELLRSGSAPGVEEFLGRCAGFRDSLRPVLEGAVKLRAALAAAGELDRG